MMNNNNDYKNDWNGGRIEEGTYFYLLHLNASPARVIKGWIQVNRN